MENFEECWVLKGRRVGDLFVARYDRYSAGQPASVAFDPKYVDKHHREIIGWKHTHPHWPAWCSDTDLRTMRAWSLSLGKPLLCMIQGTDTLRAFWFMDDESEPIVGQFIRAGKYIFGRVPNVEKIRSRTSVPEHRGYSGASG